MTISDKAPTSFILVDGQKVHFRLDGTAGPVVVLLGSLGTSIHMWDAVVSHLGSEFRILRIDHPGHGRSDPVRETSMALMADRVIAVLDALDILKVHCAGLSMGGMIAQHLALHRPERVLSLTLCATAAAIPTAEFWNNRADLAVSQGMAPIVDLSRPRWFTAGFATSPQAIETLDELMRVSPEGYAACCRAIADFDLRQEAAHITAPARLIAARDDPSTTIEMMTQLAEALPTSNLQIIENCAHILAVEQPQKTATFLEEWVRHCE